MATMHADLDTLCTAVYCTADDLLPEKPGNARRRVTDAEVATLCVAQAIMGIPSDRRFLAAARRQLGHLFPELPSQSAYWRRRLTDSRRQSVSPAVAACAATQRPQLRRARLDD